MTGGSDVGGGREKTGGGQASGSGASRGGAVLSLEDIRRQVEARVEEEAALPGGGGGDDEGGVDSDFIQECIRHNEMGDGELFKLLHRGRFVFNKAMKTWLKWSGHHWEIDHLDEASGAVEAVVEAYQAEVDRITVALREIDAKDIRKSKEALRETITKRIWALRGDRRDKCLKWAHTSMNPLAIFGDELDARPWFLACPNCVVDLKTGNERPGRPDDYLMKATSAEWRGLFEPCDGWVRTLLEIFDWDESLVDFLQRLLGYALIGAVYEAIFPTLIGPGGRNGKSTIMETVKSVLGPLAGPIPNEMLMASYKVSGGGNSPTPEIMALRGLRLAWASVPEDGARVSAGKVKWLTGKDTLVGRYPHDKHNITFEPSHTLILLSNFRPHADTNDAAFWERLISIPFKLRFIRNREPRADNERAADIGLDEKLRAEASGILAWMVRGCLAWQRKGLAPPPKVVEETQDYFASEDNMGAFVDYCCDTGEEGEFECRAKELYDLFCAWWKQYVGNFPPKQRKLGTYLKERFRSEKVGGVYRYYGIQPNPEIIEEIMPDRKG